MFFFSVNGFHISKIIFIFENFKCCTKKKLVKKICGVLRSKGFGKNDCLPLSNLVAKYDPNINNLQKLTKVYVNDDNCCQ